MDRYTMLPPGCNLSRPELISRYNDAVEYIWELLHRIEELDRDYEAMLYAYEQATDELYN